MDERNIYETRLHDFYSETEVEKRQEILNELIALGQEPENTAKLQELWSLRYQKTKRGSGDIFIRAFMELYYISGEMDTMFRKNYNKKVIKRSLKDLGISGEHSFPEEMLYKEYKHLALCYIEVTRKNGGPRVFGFSMTTKPDYIDKKLRNDFFTLGNELPEKAGLQKEFALLNRALSEAAREYLKD